MKADWKALAEISMTHLGSTVGTTASAIGLHEHTDSNRTYKGNVI
jgi:hypothetical protein